MDPPWPWVSQITFGGRMTRVSSHWYSVWSTRNKLVMNWNLSIMVCLPWLRVGTHVANPSHSACRPRGGICSQATPIITKTIGVSGDRNSAPFIGCSERGSGGNGKGSSNNCWANENRTGGAAGGLCWCNEGEKKDCSTWHRKTIKDQGTTDESSEQGKES